MHPRSAYSDSARMLIAQHTRVNEVLIPQDHTLVLLQERMEV